MFRSIMKSHKVENGEMEIFIPFVNKDQLKTILDFLYCGQIRCGSEEEADQIIRILTYDLQLLPEDADISPNFGTFDCQICHRGFGRSAHIKGIERLKPGNQGFGRLVS